MRRFWYEVIHWLFRTCELISRVCMFVAFMVTTRQKPQWRWWWCILLADFCFTAFIVTVLGGAEGTYVVRILCSSPAVFANIFAFIDSPYKRRSAKLVSRWLTIKHGLELIFSAGSFAEGVEGLMFAMEQAPEQVKPIEDTMKEAAPVPNQIPLPRFAEGVKALQDSAPQAPEAPATSAKPTRFRRDNSGKQSGVSAVKWNKGCWAWEVNFPLFDKKGKRTGRKARQFSLSKFMKEGLTETEADVAALEAAKAFRAELVKQGVLEEPKPVDPNFTSEVPGVSWNKRSKKWRVELAPKKATKGPAKQIHGGRFTEKAAAESKALELAKLHGLERKVMAVGRFSELPIFEAKVPYPGVTWERRSQKWRAQCRINGKNQHFHVKPKDHSEAELEASHKKAVVWRKKQEKERVKAAKPTRSQKESGFELFVSATGLPHPISSFWYIGLREELWVDLKDNWKNHQIMIVIALTASPLDVGSGGSGAPLGLGQARRSVLRRKCRTLLTISLRRRWTALHIAAWHGHLKVVQILLDAARGRAAGIRNAEDYWNYMFQDSANETPLHVAARGGWLEVCCCLAHHVPLWKMAMLQEPQNRKAQKICHQRSMDLRSTPLLDAAASLPNMEGWPQVQVAIDRSQHEQLIAPGLCSYIASCCGGALGRAFLMDAQPEPPDAWPRWESLNVRVAQEIHQSVLTDISEATESSETSLARGTGASGARHGANWETEAPNIDHLVPVTPTNTRVIAQWSEMSSSILVGVKQVSQSVVTSRTIRGGIIRRIPEIGIGAILGQGSYGVVWCAMDERTDKLYAVKNICKAPTTSEVSRREFEVSDRIRLTPHPCLVQLFLVHNFTDAGLYVLVMEYCSGGNLLRRIQQSLG
eukprot:g873.t1